MNAQQYADYEASVARFLKDNHVKPGCYGNVDSENPEAFFSWRKCECCGSKLGGNRETYNFAHIDSSGLDNTFTADICEDCVYYLAYGQLDDMTMLEISGN